MNHRVGAFCELIEFLHGNHYRWTRDPTADGKLRELNDTVSRSHKVIEAQKLAFLLKEAKKGGSIDFLAHGAFLFLKPPEQEGALLPVLSLKSNFSRSELRVRMALFTFGESQVPAAIGFRFETPEGEGKHNYHHAQLIRSFGKNTKDLPTPLWLPTRQPALMMSAKTPFSLFLGILIGLYGLGNLETVWQGQKFTAHLKSDLDELKIGCGAPRD